MYKFVNVILFHYYLPLEKSVVLHSLDKRESLSPKDDVC